MNKKVLSFVIKFAVSAGLIAFVLGNIDLAEVEAQLSRVSVANLALAVAGMLALFLVQMAICAFRWRAVLTPMGADIPYWQAYRLFYIGAFFNQTLPSAVGGDAVRMYLAYRHWMGGNAAVNGVMLERVATVSGLVLLVALTQPFFQPRVDGAIGTGILIGVGLGAAAMIGGTVFLALLDRAPQSWQRWAAVRAAAKLAEDTRKVFLSRGVLPALGWSTLGHANITLMIWVLALGLGVDISLLDCMALFPPVLLLMAIPISIAGWGVREFGIVTAFALVGVPEAGAASISLLFGLLGILASLPGGLVWLSLGDARKEVRAGIDVPQTAD